MSLALLKIYNYSVTMSFSGDFIECLNVCLLADSRCKYFLIKYAAFKSVELLTGNVYKSDLSCTVRGDYEAKADVEVSQCFKCRVANVLCLFVCLF